MKIKFFSLITAAILAIGGISCSDNYNKELEPVKTTKILNLDVEDKKDYSGGTLSLDAGPSNITVKVESNTRWIAEVLDCSGGWCELDAFNGSGNGTFTISVRDNMKEDRDCIVKVYMAMLEEGSWVKVEAGSKEIRVKQVASRVRLSPSSLEPFAADNPKSQEFNITANDVAWTLRISYDGIDATEFVSVTNLINMQEDSESSFSGYGNASFNIILQPNRTAANRIAFLTLSSAVGNYSVEISQLKSEYTFDVSPMETQVISAEGGTIEFGVLSLADWSVEASADWISFSPAEGEASGSRSTIIATVSPNSYGLQRSTEVRFISKDSRYPSLSVTVLQRGFDIDFSASPVETLGVLMPDRQIREFNLDSRFKWELILPNWITSETIEGEPSGSEQRISLTVSQNTSGATRNGTITVHPLPTKFGDEVTLDPSALNVEDVKFSITQFGGREPAISTPWLVEGYTQTSATVEFNFYSPFYPIAEAGLQWHKEGETEWNTQSKTIDNQTDGTVSTELLELDPATKYEARGYVVYSDGQVKYGAISFPFTTAGKRPEESDNPTPGM